MLGALYPSFSSSEKWDSRGSTKSQVFKDSGFTFLGTFLFFLSWGFYKISCVFTMGDSRAIRVQTEHHMVGHWSPYTLEKEVGLLIHQAALRWFTWRPEGEELADLLAFYASIQIALIGTAVWVLLLGTRATKLNSNNQKKTYFLNHAKESLPAHYFI